MLTTERLKKLQVFVYKNLCQGRQMKTPAKDGDMGTILRDEPKCYVGYYPMRPDTSGFENSEAINTAPSILILPSGGYVKNQEEQRFDRYNNVHRPKSMGQSLTIQVLFTVYEDGVRLPGFIDKIEKGEFDISLIREGTDEGLSVLLNWMDEFNSLLLNTKFIPETDMFVNDSQSDYGLWSDQKFIQDTRPLYHGICGVTFQCHADEYNPEIENLLK